MKIEHVPCTDRDDRTFVSAVTIAFRAYRALMKPLAGDYRCVRGAGKRPKAKPPKTVFRVGTDGKIRAIRDR